MGKKVTVILEKVKSDYVAKCVEVDVVSQGKTVGQALDRMSEAVGLYMEKSRKKMKDVYVATIEVPE